MCLKIKKSGENVKNHIGKQSIILRNKPSIISTYSTVGPKEGEGPLGKYFHSVLNDDMDGQMSYEMAESHISHTTIMKCINEVGLEDKDIDYICGGDLLNQLTATTFASRDFDIPLIGLYGACSTMTLALCVASILIDGGYGSYAIAEASSHFSSAERQFRAPLEMGGQRSPTAQWTVTGSGAMLIGMGNGHPKVTHVTFGQVKDFGEKDPTNMGGAMAPAAVHTIKTHFEDTGFLPKDYDIIATGDLGIVGRKITEEMLLDIGYDVRDIYMDCGESIFDIEDQKVNCGGSGAGCSAVVASSYLYEKLKNKTVKRILLVSTGALLSTTTSLQGESIPGIAHAITIESED